jgi:hypothetical protein
MAFTDARLAGWESYYVIVGSSGAALIGLQFVVITLIAGMRRRTDAGSLSAFGTPTVVHLTAALLISAIMSAPWPSLVPTSVALALCGLGGLVYGAAVFRRARRPALMYCGDDAGAKKVAAGLIRDVGFDPVDVGALRMARYTEPFSLLVGHLAYEGGGGPEIAYRFERFAV